MSEDLPTLQDYGYQQTAEEDPTYNEETFEQDAPTNRLESDAK